MKIIKITKQIIKCFNEPLYLKTILINKRLKLYSFKNKNRKIDLSNFDRPIKVNLGCGLKVAEGWINIDYNLHSLYSEKNYSLNKINKLYDYLKQINYSELNRPYRFSLSKNDFIQILDNNIFICHNLLFGIPFSDNSIDYFYSSHMIGFSFPKNDSIFVLNEVFRKLKPGGKIRLSILDGEYYWNERNHIDKKNKLFNHNNDNNCFSYIEIKKILKEIGFSNIEQKTFQDGSFPDLSKLEDYSPELDEKLGSKTLYIEATK